MSVSRRPSSVGSRGDEFWKSAVNKQAHAWLFYFFPVPREERVNKVYRPHVKALWNLERVARAVRVPFGAGAWLEKAPT